MAKVSIRDVATHAGVSIATVSNVINNTRFVKEETRNLVLKASMNFTTAQTQLHEASRPGNEI